MIDHRKINQTTSTSSTDQDGDLSALAQFEPERQSIGAQVVSKLREAILGGELKPGQRLVERKLAKTMGVSQGAVREGLQALTQEGLLTKKANAATHVTTLSSREVAELADLRVDLEAKAFALAQRRISSEWVAKLEALVGEMDQSRATNDYHRVYRADFEFHKTVWRMSGNATLERILTQLCTPLFAFLMVYLSSGHRDLNERVVSHQMLIDVLRESSRIEEIRSAIREHFRDSWLQYLYEHESLANEAIAPGAVDAGDKLKLIVASNAMKKRQGSRRDS